MNTILEKSIREKKLVRGFSMQHLQPKNGFTLIEILVVVGLVAAIAVGGYVVSIGSFQRNAFSTERDLVLSLLQKARSRALANIHESEHGVVIESDRIVVFEDIDEDQNFDDPDEIIDDVPLEGLVTYVGDDIFLFQQLSGNAPDENGTITLTGPRLIDTADITVELNGRINWAWN